MGEQSHRLIGERYINVQLWHSVVSRYFDAWKYVEAGGRHGAVVTKRHSLVSYPDVNRRRRSSK